MGVKMNMALQLMKIAISGTIDTDVNPESEKFFYITTENTPAGSTLSIDAESFLADDGSEVEILPDLIQDNSYYTVEINGVEQMQGLSTYTPGATGTGSLDIALPPGGGSIPANQTVILQVVNFTATSSGTFNS